MEPSILTQARNNFRTTSTPSTGSSSGLSLLGGGSAALQPQNTGAALTNYTPGVIGQSLLGRLQSGFGNVVNTLQNKAAGLTTSSAISAQQQELARQQANFEREMRISTPSFMDMASAQAKARAEATKTNDVKYNYLLNNMLKDIALEKTRGEQDTAMANQALEDTLKQNLDTSQMNRTRTAEDADLANQQLNVDTERTQADQAATFEEERFAQLRQQAASGMIGEGVGGQQVGQTKANRNLVEQRQAEDTQYQKLAVATSKARTWEDLAKSDEWAQYSATKGKEANKLNLDRLYEDMKIKEEKDRNTLTVQKGADQLLEENRLLRMQINEFIGSQAGRENAAATASFYGGIS